MSYGNKGQINKKSSFAWSTVHSAGHIISSQQIAEDYIKDAKPDHNIRFIKISAISDIDNSHPVFMFECKDCCTEFSVYTEEESEVSPAYNRIAMGWHEYEDSCDEIKMERACR